MCYLVVVEGVQWSRLWLMCGVVWYCVFFFFKQKTAYEMRISDWSSDVCSSDLILAACRDAGISPRDIDGFTSYAGGQLNGPQLAADLGIREQIGRASCRERVCQYV